jgi:hypothetical protein
MPRHDITDWVIHFIHRRSAETDPLAISFEPKGLKLDEFPDNFSYNGEPIYLPDRYENYIYNRPSDDYSFSVLKKIMHDGFIRAGWSFRNSIPTIYGPKAAVCFTEMPLYGLIEYAKNRNKQHLVEDYGIAFLKRELFGAGARPVIYGLSTVHKEAEDKDLFFCKGFRNLSSETGIGLKEQYRYVYTKLDSSKKTDWTHEREWRWADLDEAFEFPGLPLFAETGKVSFTKVIIIVKTSLEAQEIVGYLKTLHDSGGTNFNRRYDLKIISNTNVVAIDELKKVVNNMGLIKLDDLPLHSLHKIKKVTVSRETLEKVKSVWEQANVISLQKSTEFYEKYPVTKNGFRPGRSGFTKIVTFDASSEVTQALINLNIAVADAEGFYELFGLKYYHCQLLEVEEEAANAATEFLTAELGQDSYFESYYY